MAPTGKKNQGEIMLNYILLTLLSVSFGAPSATKYINNGAAKIALPNVSGTMATDNNALTFSNKSLTSPIITGGSLNFGTIGSSVISGSIYSLGTLSGSTLSNGTISSGVASALTVSGSTLGTSVINTSTINSPIVSLGTLSGSTLSAGTISSSSASAINISSGTASLSKIRSNHIEFTKLSSSPNTPGTGTLSLYLKDDNKAYLTDSTGTDIGLGSAGDASNILTNASFSSGTSGHTLPAGTAAIETSFIVPPDSQSLRFSLSSTSGTILSQVIQPTGSLGGVNLEASLYVATTVGSLEVCAMQGTNAVQCNDVPTSGKWSYVPANMAGPSSGSIGYALRTKDAVAVTGTVYTARAYTGTARNLYEVSQATLYGKVVSDAATNCSWDLSNPAVFTSFSADSDCNTATATGAASAPATKIPAISFTSLPPGRYIFVVRTIGGYMAAAAASETDVGAIFRLYDGTNGFGGSNVRCIQASFCTDSEFTAEIEYTTAQSNLTVQLQTVESVASTTDIGVANNNTTYNGKFEISVYRYPTQNETVARSSDNSWYVDANMAGANPALGTVNVASYTEITDSGLTLTPASGSAPVGAMCSSTNAATSPSTSATTCAAGSESVGFTTSIPKAGLYEICAYFSFSGSSNQSSLVFSTFELYETPTNAQTLTQRGRTRLITGGSGGSTAGNTSVHVSTQANCALFNFTTGGQKGIRLMYEQEVTGTASAILIGDASASSGDRDIRFTMRPWNTNFSAPTYVGSVTSNSTGMERIERARITGASTITRQSGSWISSVTNNGTGDRTLNLASGIFSGTPSCFFTVDNTGAAASNRLCELYSSSTSAIRFTCAGDTTPSDYAADVVCMGPR
jgi:hypothetical protein